MDLIRRMAVTDGLATDTIPDDVSLPDLHAVLEGRALRRFSKPTGEREGGAFNLDQVGSAGISRKCSLPRDATTLEPQLIADAVQRSAIRTAAQQLKRIHGNAERIPRQIGGDAQRGHTVLRGDDVGLGQPCHASPSEVLRVGRRRNTSEVPPTMETRRTKEYPEMLDPDRVITRRVRKVFTPTHQRSSPRRARLTSSRSAARRLNTGYLIIGGSAKPMLGESGIGA